MKLLLIEDNEILAATLKKGLEHEGYTVDTIADGLEGYKRLLMERTVYDLVLLDLMLPNKDGISICTDWRTEGVVTPVLMLTARDTTADTVQGLDAGADDYLVKPFEFDELLARIRALLRRPTISNFDILTVGELALNEKTRTVALKGKLLNLTLQEYRMLEYFMHHPNQVVEREQILSAVWDFAYQGLSNVVDVHIRNIRKKLGKYGRTIKTVRGIGYQLEI